MALTTAQIDEVFETMRQPFHDFFAAFAAQQARLGSFDIDDDEAQLAAFEARDKFDFAMDSSIVAIAKLIEPTSDLAKAVPGVDF